MIGEAENVDIDNVTEKKIFQDVWSGDKRGE
jgi:hypothetical protein